MPIIWNQEADAKLFVGVLGEFKNSNLKLDYKRLAAHMGPECSVPAVKQHIQKLRRDAEGLSGAGADAQGKMETPTPNESFAVGTKRKRTGGGKRATKRTKGGDASAAAPTPIVEIPPAAAKGEEGGDKEEE